jgi:hypothetical protein
MEKNKTNKKEGEEEEEDGTWVLENKTIHCTYTSYIYWKCLLLDRRWDTGFVAVTEMIIYEHDLQGYDSGR